MIAGFLKRAGIDRPVGLSLLNNGWTVVSGVLTLTLLVHFLSPGQQGFYYSFNNFLNAALLFELGLSYVILQFASHERAKLEWTAEGTLTGNPAAKSRLAGLLRVSLRWYAVTALLTLLVLLPSGLVFFTHYAPVRGHFAWRGAWLLLSFGASLLMLLTPLPALLEGCGLVAEVGAVRAGITIYASLLQWTILLLHGGLYSAAAISITGIIGVGGWLWHRHRPFLRDLLAYQAAPEDENAFSWRKDLWPFQWKVGLTSLSYFVIVPALTLILMAARGAVAAGQLGLSLGLMTALFKFPQAWLTTKTQPFGTLIAQERWQELDTLFFPTLWRSWMLAVLLGTALWLGAACVNWLGLPLAHRMLSPLPFGLLIAASVVSHGVSAEALYLRAHKQEPFMWLSLVVAALIGAGNLLVARLYGATGMMLVYFLVYLTISFGGGTWIFVQKRRLWHAAPVSVSAEQPF